MNTQYDELWINIIFASWSCDDTANRAQKDFLERLSFFLLEQDVNPASYPGTSKAMCARNMGRFVENAKGHGKAQPEK